MKNNLARYITALTLFAALAIPVQLAAQDKQRDQHMHHHYQLIDVGTLGGPNSYLSGPGVQTPNNRGTFAGIGNTTTPNPNPGCFLPFGNAPDCFVQNPFVWQNGAVATFPVLLGGANSQTDSISSNGLISGWSENGIIDPMTGLPEDHAVLWTKDRQVIDLGTVTGGTESLAASNNSHGQVVGFSNNDVPDPFSIVGFPTQTRAFLWKNGAMQDLGTLGGPDALAQVMNERGQIAGFSYTNSTANSTTGIPTQDPFLWQGGAMIDLGTLGGTRGLANWLNGRGQVVGQSNLAGDNTSHPFFWDKKTGLKDLGNFGGNGNNGAANWINDEGDVVGWADLPGSQAYHAFLWKHGVMTDLGTPIGDECSIAYAINSKRQVVGESWSPCNGNGNTWLWENDGRPMSLDTLILPGSGVLMYDAWYINDRGEIPGSGVLLSTGDLHAVLLIPCDEEHPDVEGCDYTLVDEVAATRENPTPVIQKPMTTGPRTNSVGRIPWRRLGPLSDILRPAPAEGGSVSNSTEAGSGPHILTPPRAGSGTESTPATEAGTSLRITSGLPPSGRVGRLYDERCNQIPPCNVILAGFPVTAAGGLQPYSWSWTAQGGSSLPPGLGFFARRYWRYCENVLPPDICGKPTTAGSYKVVITVADSESPPRHASQRFSIQILP